MKHAVISLSGGMDSSTLLLNLLDNRYTVTAVSFDYGQKHRVELDRAKELVDYLEDKGIKLDYRVIRLDGLTSLLNSTLVQGGAEVPEGHYQEENMKATVVPNRNKIFSSIIQAIALSKLNTGVFDEVVIAMGIHAGDHDIYPDCRQEFRDADYDAFIKGNWDAEKITYYTPYLQSDKYDILGDGYQKCANFGISFDEVYKRTNTSYKPIQHDGIWYSDYKSASSVERVEAFIKLGVADPVAYADENGPVEWSVVKSYVINLLKQHQDA